MKQLLIFSTITEWIHNGCLFQFEKNQKQSCKARLCYNDAKLVREAPLNQPNGLTVVVQYIIIVQICYSGKTLQQCYQQHYPFHLHC